jgi:hypothetical protein
MVRHGQVSLRAVATRSRYYCAAFEKDRRTAYVDVLYKPIVPVFQGLRVVQIMTGVIVQDLLWVARGGFILVY